MAIEANSQNGHFDLGDAAKKAAIVGGGAAAAVGVYALGQFVIETAGPIFATQKRIDLGRQTRLIHPEALSLGLDPEKIHSLTIIVGGDSQLLKDGLSVDGNEQNPSGSLDETARRLIRRKYGIPVTTYNCAIEGHTATETREEIRSGKLGEHLRSTPGVVVAAIGDHGNELRGYIKNNKVADQLRKISEKISLPTGISLARRYIGICSEFETNYMKLLQEFDNVNMDRVQNGLEPIAGLCLFLPSDFGDASKVAFVPFKEVSKEVDETSFDMEQPVLHNIATLVADSITGRIRKAYGKFMNKRESNYPTALVPMHGKIESKHYTIGQHTGRKGQRRYGLALTEAIFKPAA